MGSQSCSIKVRRLASALVWGAVLVCSGLATVRAAGGEALIIPEPTDAARRAAKAIRSEALLPPNGPRGHPLPLASHWNVGAVEGTFEPVHQIAWLQQGRHILPWATWPSGDPHGERFQQYWVPLIQFWKELNLPVSFRGTQWNAMLVKKAYRDPANERPWAGVITPAGKRVPKLSPFGDIEAWEDPAEAYVATPAMRWIQRQYPEPPLVLWVSNNEPPDIRWHEVEEQSRRYLDRYGKGRSDEFKRKVVGDGWIERYGTMFRAMRRALENDAWRRNVRFIGYGAFGASHFGRWDGWKAYSLITSERVDPSWYVWDGGSPSYYTHNWNANRDHWVFSTQVQSMNWLFMLDRAWQVNPDFWFEMSTWDGNEVNRWMQGLGIDEDQPELLVERSSRQLSDDRIQLLRENLQWVKKSKALQYMAEGQTYPPERTLGWVQYGMWLLRPRVVREFRGHTTPLKPVKEYWLQTLKAVDRVHENAVLETFWRHGELAANRARRHPYQAAIPEGYRDIHRWYLLETDLDPAPPWDHKTDLPVFSLALVKGEAPERKWLVYAHSPLKNRRSMAIKIPEYGEVTVDVPRAGAFYRVEEKSGAVTRLNFSKSK